MQLLPALRDDWRKILARANSVRVAVAWGVVCGLMVIWPAFQDLMPLGIFALLGVALSVAVVIARVTHQPGME